MKAQTKNRKEAITQKEAQAYLHLHPDQGMKQKLENLQI